jgi:pimeloyl-ACP methyl ester carboxylesterase
MLPIILYALAFLIAIILILYLFFPQILFDRARKALRSRGDVRAQRVDVGGISWPYLEGGNPNGPPLVLVHGFGGDKDNWVFLAPHMKSDFRLIFPDMPGFGENTRDLALDYDMATQAARLRGFLDALGLDRVHLGGNSMGGCIALRFAIDFPERLSSLTLFNNAGVLGTKDSELQDVYNADPTVNPLIPRDAGDFDRLMAFIAVNPRPIPGQFKKLLYADFDRNRALLDKIFFGMAAELLANPYNDDLGRVTAPTLIIWGRQDRLIDPTCADVQHAGIAGSEIMIFENVGHVPMVEDPAACAAVQRPFLAKHA